jgi:hypothetical protein
MVTFGGAPLKGKTLLRMENALIGTILGDCQTVFVPKSVLLLSKPIRKIW